MKEIIKTYKTFDSITKKFQSFSLIICVGSIFAVAFMGFLLYSQSQKTTWLVDNQGDIASAIKVSDSDIFLIEADNHIRMFVSRFFTYEKSNYNEQINAGLILGGKSVKLLYETYRTKGWYDRVVNNDLVINSSVKDIQLQLVGNERAIFVMQGEQEIRRGDLREIRRLDVKGIIYRDNTGRVAQKNPHGMKIDDIVITNNSTLSVNGEPVKNEISNE